MTTHEAIWPESLFETGIGWVIVARFKSAGQIVEAGIFLVDVFCLGVKIRKTSAGPRNSGTPRRINSP